MPCERRRSYMLANVSDPAPVAAVGRLRAAALPRNMASNRKVNVQA